MSGASLNIAGNNGAIIDYWVQGVSTGNQYANKPGRLVVCGPNSQTIDLATAGADSFSKAKNTNIVSLYDAA